MINDQLCRTWDLSKTFESICNLQVVATSELLKPRKSSKT
jgi:hypothetical protein